jgi:hypothetical protein
MRNVTHHCRFYYGKHCRNEFSGPGQLALETWHVGETSKDLEIEIGKQRKDIGRIDVRAEPREEWLTVYRE